MAARTCVSSPGQSSRSRERTRDRWVPRLRWIPEHSMQISAPKLRLAQVGSAGQEEGGWSLKCKWWHQKTSAAGAKNSLGASQSTHRAFPLVFRMAWRATASLWLLRRAWTHAHTHTSCFTSCFTSWLCSTLDFTLWCHCCYLVSATLTGLQTGQNLAFDGRHPRVPLLQALSLKVPRLPGERHNEEVCVLFFCR